MHPKNIEQTFPKDCHIQTSTFSIGNLEYSIWMADNSIDETFKSYHHLRKPLEKAIMVQESHHSSRKPSYGSSSGVASFFGQGGAK